MVPAVMHWRLLLQPRRLGKPGHADTTDPSELRTEFFKDWDRIVFCSAFRRLQDKTQVHPVARTDYVRTRLTHSLEVASVGRSLGMQAGRVIGSIDPSLRDVAAPQDVGAIVAAACLMHDIGNPPFGHSGEAAIREFFSGEGRHWLDGLSPARQADLLHFEGNAQGLRTVLRLQHPDQPAGLQLTMPTLGAFVKYPCDAVHGLRAAQGVGLRKFGFMDSERPWFRELASQLGLKPREPGGRDEFGASCVPGGGHGESAAWHRHPLAFLVEAADDICYGVIDIEDGVKSGHIAFDELEALHAPFIDAPHCERARALGDRQHRAEYLRAVTIGVLVERAARVFHDRHDDLLAGRFDEPLLDGIEGAAAFQRFRQLAAERLYEERSKLAWQVAGFEIIGWLLRNFCEAVERMAEAGSPTERARMLVRVMPGGAQAAALPQRYLRLLRVTDFVAGMTDRYAVDTCLRLRGLGADR